jgi:monofunctional glycosyltransferase
MVGRRQAKADMRAQLEPILTVDRPTGARAAVRRLGRWLVGLLLALAGLWLGLALVYRWIEPPLTPLMLLRLTEAPGIDHRPVPLLRLAPVLEKAVIASEDNRFCEHYGIDWQAVGSAIDEYQVEGRLRGASTITMQAARNLFLWPGGGFLRKGVESALALLLEALWSKKRILEVYLNVVEWGEGVYGAEAASRLYFHASAARLDRRQAALLAAVLPNPRRWSPAHPDRYIARRADLIERRMDQLEGPYYACLR